MPFDFIITITIGSAFGQILTAKEVSLAESFVTFILLIELNYIFSLLESRSRTFKNWINSQPRLVFYRGEFLKKPMRKERLRNAAARKSKVVNMEDVETIVLETDGSFSVLFKASNTGNTTFNHLVN